MNTNSNIYDTAYFYLTEEGAKLCDRLSAAHPGDIYGKEDFKNNLRDAFSRYDNLVCVMATGIVVRILAPLIVHKTSDPAVVVLDQKGRHAISLLSGHLGGANDLAREMAAISGGDPVITTATDVAGELSFDSFAKAHNMAIENIGSLKHISGALLSGHTITVITDYQYEEISKAAKEGKMRLIGTNRFNSANEKTAYSYKASECPDTTADPYKASEKPEAAAAVVIDEGLILPEEITSSYLDVLYLRPRTIYAGIGCKRNMEAEPIEAALRQVLEEEGLSPLSLACISTIPLKANEPGILTTADRLGVTLTIIPTEEIEQLDMQELNIRPSEFVAQQTGVPSVSTASSYLASGKGQILRDKVKFKGITIALSKKVQDE